MLYEVITEFGSTEKFSFESRFLETGCQRSKLSGVVFEDYFIDIGIPEDFERAQIDFKNKF